MHWDPTSWYHFSLNKKQVYLEYLGNLFVVSSKDALKDKIDCLVDIEH